MKYLYYRAYRWNVDTNRFPQYILEATSLCKVSDCGEGKHCRPVTEDVNVLFKTRRCRKGYWQYDLKTISIAKSFVCAAL